MANNMKGCYKHLVLENLKQIQSFRYQQSSEGITITVTPHYVSEKSAPENDYYFFAYQVLVENDSSERVQLISRHWIIRDGQKRERFINGEGVTGKRPFIEPGEIFEYQSFCPLSTATGNMRGKFEFVNELGEKFWRPIPLFFFRTPESFKH